MTEKRESVVPTRRAEAEREILDAAWAEMAREGVAAVSVREVARSVGIRQQSLTYYFQTKHALLDALFADGFTELRRRFDELPPVTDPVQGVVDVATAFVEHLVARPAAYHLMFQGTVPGFRPTQASHDIALAVLRALTDRLAAAGLTDPADLALIRSVMSGIAAEQIANDPGGRLFVDQTERGIRAVLTLINPTTGPPGSSSRQPPAEQSTRQQQATGRTLR